MFTLTCCIIICWALVIAYQTTTPEEYYWRDYINGQIPEDAVAGGYDKYKKPTYVGVAVHPQGNGLLPANIYPDLFAMTHAGLVNNPEMVHIHTNYLKILCTSNKTRLRWIQTSSDAIFSLEGKPIKGGQEYDWDLYVGRTFYKGERRIGRVFPPHSQYEGLWLPVEHIIGESGEFKHFTDFEILVYK